MALTSPLPFSVHFQLPLGFTDISFPLKLLLFLYYPKYGSHGGKYVQLKTGHFVCCLGRGIRTPT